MIFLGDFAASATVRLTFTTNTATGASVAPSSAFEAADLLVYKDGSATARTSSSGITMTSPFASLTGLHHVSLDLSDDTDAGFWAAGHDYAVVLSPDTETVDGQTVVAVLAQFSIVNRADAAGVTTLLSRLSSTRAGYLDNLSAGAVALEASLQGLITTIGAAAAGVAAAVWGAATRLLTAGTNIVLAKGTGVTGFTDLSAAAVNAEVDTALADVGVTTTVTGRIDAAVTTRASQTSADDLPTTAELATALGTADDATLAAIAALAIPTATQNADALLKRDMSAVTGEADRSPLNALRFLRNKWSIAGSTLTITKEDDTAEAWTAEVTQTAGDPVSAIDPAP